VASVFRSKGQKKKQKIVEGEKGDQNGRSLWENEFNTRKIWGDMCRITYTQREQERRSKNDLGE